MLHIHNAHKIRVSYLVTTAFLLVAGLYAQQNELVLDFTKPAPPNAKEMLSAPGYSSKVPKFTLPLSVILHRIRRMDGDDYNIELILQNTGVEVFDLPISRDAADVLRAGNTARTMLVFQLRASGEKPNEKAVFGLATTSGSVSVRGSFLPLKPRQTVTVIVNARLQDLRLWKSGGTTTSQVEASCSEWKLDDSRFYIKAASELLNSVNQVKLPL